MVTLFFTVNGILHLYIRIDAAHWNSLAIVHRLRACMHYESLRSEHHVYWMFHVLYINPLFGVRAVTDVTLTSIVHHTPRQHTRIASPEVGDQSVGEKRHFQKHWAMFLCCLLRTLSNVVTPAGTRVRDVWSTYDISRRKHTEAKKSATSNAREVTTNAMRHARS